MLGAKTLDQTLRLAALLSVVAAASLLVSCGSPLSKEDAASTATAKGHESAAFPLVVDGDRLGVSSLDGNPPTPVSDPGFVDGVAYGPDGALTYVQHSGRQPSFYRVEDRTPQLVIPLPRTDPQLPAKWSPDASRAAWIEADGKTTP